MLINGQRAEELRVAIVSGVSLENYQVERAEAGLCRGNIYRGVVVNVQPSLNAAFIDFGADRHGFLAIQDVVEQAWHRRPPDGESRPRIEQVLERGKSLLVQVTKDAVSTKGAAVTTNLSLAGRYLVFTPYEEARGVSRKVDDEATRKAVKEKAKGLDVPKGAGYIIRTNAADQSKAALSRDLSALQRLFKRIVTAGRGGGKGPKLLYSDQDLLVQALRDYLDATIEEVVIDEPVQFEKAAAFMKTFMPRSKVVLSLYQDRLPLFSRFALEDQIDGIFQRTVPLPGGGSLVIDGTEALTAIDVNSGKSHGSATQEETAYHTNLEAAAEVARQLRLRDIGGLIVVDFIDMRASKYQRAVEKTLKEAMKNDKARSSVSRLSENGLLEINRQRIKAALQTRTHRNCPTCGGTGMLPSQEHVGLSLMRRIEARAATGKVKSVRVKLHPELADHLQNDRRKELAALEEEFAVRIEIIASPALHRSQEQVEWFDRPAGAPPPPPPRRAAVMSVLDLASEMDEEELDEDEDGDEDEATGPAAPGRPTPASQPREATPAPRPREPAPAEPAHGADDEAGEGRSSRRRRRNRRAHRTTGAPATGTGAPPTVASPTAGPAPAANLPEPADPEGDAPEGEEPGHAGADEAGGSSRSRRRRRRGGRRRKHGGEGGAPPAGPSS
jgi:ribonuclease E